MSRNIKKSIKLLVEGTTEENYFKSFNKSPNLSFSVKPVNMRGGGYINFLNKLRKESTLGIVAIFVFIDLDKAIQEKDELEKLIEFCNQKNKKSKVPYFLIGTNKSFEYFACCHCEKYRDTNPNEYINKEFKYPSISKFKSDSKLFEFLNREKRSYNNAIKKSCQKTPYFHHEYSKKESGTDINIKINKAVKVNFESLSYNHSNINEFFDIISKN